MRLEGSLALLDSPFGRWVSYVLELAHAEALIISRKCNDQVHTKANDDGHWQNVRNQPLWRDRPVDVADPEISLWEPIHFRTKR
jgi:hypothetical protein